MKLPKLEPSAIEYPESDGKPMAETDDHRIVMVETIDTVDLHFAHADDVYVSGNLFVYYVEGNPRKSVSPDFLFVRGVPRGLRRVYKTWVEGKGLDVVMEMTSPSTYRHDIRGKREIYERLGVQEYFLFDPLRECIDPPLRCFERRDGQLVPAEPARLEGGVAVLSSAVLGLDLLADGARLRLRDARTGEVLLPPRQLAEAEHRRAEEAHHRAEAERRRADEERRRAEGERARLEALEAENERLRRELEDRESAAE